MARSKSQVPRAKWRGGDRGNPPDQIANAFGIGCVLAEAGRRASCCVHNFRELGNYGGSYRITRFSGGHSFVSGRDRLVQPWFRRLVTRLWRASRRTSRSPPVGRGVVSWRTHHRRRRGARHRIACAIRDRPRADWLVLPRDFRSAATDRERQHGGPLDQNEPEQHPSPRLP